MQEKWSDSRASNSRKGYNLSNRMSGVAGTKRATRPTDSGQLGYDGVCIRDRSRAFTIPLAPPPLTVDNFCKRSFLLVTGVSVPGERFG